MYLGFDTSNYTTSIALFDGKNIKQEKSSYQSKRAKEDLGKATLYSSIPLICQG